jgi:hypothetical protein
MNKQFEGTKFFDLVRGILLAEEEGRVIWSDRRTWCIIGLDGCIYLMCPVDCTVKLTSCVAAPRAAATKAELASLLNHFVAMGYR